MENKEIFLCQEVGSKTWLEVKAIDHEDAAETFCIMLDECGGEGPTTHHVRVKRKGSEYTLEYDVDFDTSVTYTAVGR